MIHRPSRFWEALINVVDRIDAAHGDIRFLIDSLRDTANTIVWTIDPPDGQGTRYGLLGVQQIYSQQRQRMLTLRNTAVASILDRLLPEYTNKAISYVQDIGTPGNMSTLCGMIQQVLDRHTISGVMLNEAITNGERNQLANALEGLLEP